MQDVIEQVLGYARGAWRFRWFVFVIAWPVAIGGWYYVSQVPDSYKASARVFVDTRSLLNPILRGLTIQTNIGSEIDLITKTIFSRPNLEKIARMTDMDLEAKNEEEMERILRRIKSKLRLRSVGGNLFRITYTDKDPELAKAAVQALLTIFVESTLGDKRRDSSSAQKFVDEQIHEYEQRIIDAENRLRDFKRENLGNSGSIEGHYANLQKVKGKLRDINLAKREAENRRSELLRQLKKLESGNVNAEDLLEFPDSSAGRSIYDEKIRQLQAQKEQLLIRYTENYPGVISIDNTIARLNERKLQESGNGMSSVDPDILASPVYQQTKLLLGEVDANLASLKVRKKEYDNRVNRLEGLIDTIPLIKTELKRLNRDYNLNKRNYDALVSRREKVKLGEEAQQSGDTLKFRTIDPPFVSNKPSGPNRPFMISVAFGAALIAGMIFPVFLSLIKPCVESTRSLQTLTGLTVIGGVSLNRTKSQVVRRRIELLSFIFMVGLLLAAYAGVMTITRMGIKIF